MSERNMDSKRDNGCYFCVWLGVVGVCLLVTWELGAARYWVRRSAKTERERFIQRSKATALAGLWFRNSKPPRRCFGKNILLTLRCFEPVPISYCFSWSQDRLFPRLIRRRQALVICWVGSSTAPVDRTSRNARDVYSTSTAARCDATPSRTGLVPAMRIFPVGDNLGQH